MWNAGFLLFQIAKENSTVKYLQQPDTGSFKSIKLEGTAI